MMSPSPIESGKILGIIHSPEKELAAGASLPPLSPEVGEQQMVGGPGR